jgi:hypothetical protein
MALAKCADCGRDVSTEAAACPNCGRPMAAAAAAQTPTPAQPAPATTTQHQAATDSTPASPESSPSVPSPPTAAVQPSKPKSKNWFRRHPIITGILAVFLLIVIIGAAAGKENKPQNASSGLNNPPVVTTPTTKHSKPPKPKPTPKPSLTGPQQQAIQSAQSYLSEGTGFSYKGLVHQLDSKYGEGFPEAVAAFAVNYLHVNWYAQAVQSAKSYKSDGMGFSCSSMIQQLSSSSGENFTHAQAVYGAHKAGVC